MDMMKFHTSPMRYLRLLQDCDVKIYVGQLIVSHTTHNSESAATKPKQRSVHDYVPRQEIQCGGKCLYLKKKTGIFHYDVYHKQLRNI